MSVNGIPVIWMPASDEDYRDASEGGRSGYQPIAIVHHRIVGGLASADSIFAANDTNPATVGSTGRAVSANFAIGYDSDGKLYIHQYVDLSDTPYTNGDCRAINYPGQPSRWDGWYGHKGHNERTVTIEHDDQGGSSDPLKKGVVREDIIKASIALDRIMLRGSQSEMQAAGIHIRDRATADALEKIIPSTKTLLDHNDIAGANKPYCWRPWSGDKVGFPRARYVTELSSPVVVVPPPPPPPPPPADPVTYTQVQYDAALKSCQDASAAALAVLEASISATVAVAVQRAKQDQYDLDKVTAEASPINLGPRP